METALKFSPEQKRGTTQVTIEIIRGGDLSSEQIADSQAFYSLVRQGDEAVKIGLYGDDFKAALEDENSIVIKYSSSEDEAVYSPLLVSSEITEWYNTELMKETLGEDKKFLYFAHPYIPEDESAINIIANAVRNELESGAVVFFDKYASQELPKALNQLISSNFARIENLGRGEEKRTANVYAGIVTYEGVAEIKKSEHVLNVYRKAIENGLISVDNCNGLSAVAVVDGDDAEEMWRVYDEPFADLGKDDPTYAGFSKEMFMETLANPEVAKVVVKDNNKVVAMCMFVEDFKLCPWFNEQYYKNNYPQQYETGNIIIFPGIVASKQAKGNSFGLEMVNFATQLYRLRGSNGILTFECTGVSSKYIPRIINFAINHSENSAITEEILQPISTTEYLALVPNN